MPWPVVPLSSLCRQHRETASGIDDLPYIAMDQVQGHTGEIRLESGARSGAGEGVTFRFDVRHVLYGKLRPYLNKVATPNFVGRCSTELVPLLPHEGVDRTFLAYLLRRDETIRTVMAAAVGARMPRTSMDVLLAMLVPFPPLTEQKRIVDILERAASIQRLRKAADEKAREIIPALFVDMFDELPVNPHGWPTMALGRLARFVSGGTPSKARSEYWSGDVPWVSPKDMKVWSINDAQDHISERVFRETNIKAIGPAAVLIVVRGMILAHTVPTAINECRIAINQDMKAIVPGESVLPQFLLWALRTRHSELLGLVGTAAHGTKKIDTEHLERFEILVPPLALQQRFAEIADRERRRLAQGQAASLASESLRSSLTAQLIG